MSVDVTSVRYDPSKTKWPDANEYHPVEDYDKLAAALKDKAPFGFKVGNGDLYNPNGRAPYFGCDSDPFWDNHLKGAEARGLITVGYWWGPQAMDVYLKMYPPKEGRIPALDFEGSHVNDPDWFARSATRLHSEWGRWPWFYGGISWRTHRKDGTSIENCPYWPPGYNGEWIPTGGVGPVVAHQYAASCRGPEPHSFPGVNPCSDMNTLLVPFSEVRKMAGLDQGGEELLDRTKDKDTFKLMLADQLGTPSAAFWEAFEIGVGDATIAGRGHRDEMKARPGYEQGFAVGKQQVDTAAQVAELASELEALKGAGGVGIQDGANVTVTGTIKTT